jgi:hypothetical protein
LKTTEHFGLIKPELSDPANIEATNGNWDKVDEELQRLSDEVDGISPDSIIEQNNGDEQLFWVGTKAEYDAILVKDPNTSYTVTDEVDDSELAKDIENLSTRTTELEARNNVRFENWNTTIKGNASDSHSCGGKVVAVIVAARRNNVGAIITGIWTPQTSGMENCFHGYLGDSVLDQWYTTVSISGNNVTINRNGPDTITYYCTAVIV